MIPSRYKKPNFHHNFNKRYKLKAIFKIYIFSICLFAVACSSNNNSEELLSERPGIEKTEPIDVNFEVKIVNPDSSSVDGMRLTIITSSDQQTVMANNNGIAQLTVRRMNSEPITFKFQKFNMEWTETVRTLPSALSFAGLVFEVVSPTRIKLSHYTVDGLYR